MTDKQIKEQIADIRTVTKSASISKAAAAAFLRAAGIAQTPKKPAHSATRPKR